jgi:hypothetical protein
VTGGDKVTWLGQTQSGRCAAVRTGTGALVNTEQGEKMSNISEGLDLGNYESTSQSEIDNHLTDVLRRRGPLYEVSANALMLDYNPKFAKLHRRVSDFLGRPDPVNDLLQISGNLASYMLLGWETGIRNNFMGLRRNGLTKEQTMELVMFTQLYAGMRGLGHVYRAVGDFLPAWAPPDVTPEYPEGWAADPDAFKSGLDLSTREMTVEDRENLTGWYEKTIGYVPASILFGLKYHPEFTKVNRAKWEVALRTVPKQLAPYLMLRHNMLTQSVEGLREAALLGKAWGINKHYTIHAITMTAFYFTGFEGLYAAHEALDDLLEDWD